MEAHTLQMEEIKRISHISLTYQANSPEQGETHHH